MEAAHENPRHLVEMGQGVVGHGSPDHAHLDAADRGDGEVRYALADSLVHGAEDSLGDPLLQDGQEQGLLALVEGVPQVGHPAEFLAVEPQFLDDLAEVADPIEHLQQRSGEEGVQLVLRSGLGLDKGSGLGRDHIHFPMDDGREDRVLALEVVVEEALLLAHRRGDVFQGGLAQSEPLELPEGGVEDVATGAFFLGQSVGRSFSTIRLHKSKISPF